MRKNSCWSWSQGQYQSWGDGVIISAWDLFLIHRSHCVVATEAPVPTSVNTSRMNESELSLRSFRYLEHWVSWQFWKTWMSGWDSELCRSHPFLHLDSCFAVGNSSLSPSVHQSHFNELFLYSCLPAIESYTLAQKYSCSWLTVWASQLATKN